MTQRARRLWWMLPCLAACAAVVWTYRSWHTLPEGLQAEFVGRAACAQCHAAQTRDWTGSDHDRAMDLATPQTVLADFANRRLDHHGVSWEMGRDGERFWVRTVGKSGKVETFPIKYVLGVRPLQQYLVEFPDGRVQCLPVVWDVAARRWFHLYPHEKLPPHDPLHWTAPLQNWNYMCAECHSTNVRKNFDLARNEYRTTFSEIDVSCEACHGPASIHVRAARSGASFWGRYGTGLARLKGGDATAELEACARCHARREVIHDGFQPGRPFYDYYAPALLDGPTYQRDGQLLEEAYEYSSFLQSKMYHKGVRCSDCHDPHTARLKRAGNQTCTKCHQAGRYDTPIHHHHPDGKGGSGCVDCHMPTKTYMGIDVRRDHSLRVPRPDLSDRHGTPNACAACHEKQSAAWAAEAVARWFGAESAVRREHFSNLLVLARAGGSRGREAAVKLSGGKNVPDLVRASAVAILRGAADDDARRATTAALADRSPLVRREAAANVEVLRLANGAELLAPLLGDARRMVRVEAARALAALPRGSLKRPEREAFERAIEEYRQGQAANVDQAAAHLNLGVVADRLGDPDGAIAAYETALRLDRQFVPARNNLALLLAERGDSARAETLLREVTALAPDWPEGFYSLGLLLGERPERLADAVTAFERAVQLDPDRARLHYNLGLAHQHLGHGRQAEQALLRAAELEPGTPDFLQALVILYRQAGKPERAERYQRELRLLQGP